MQSRLYLLIDGELIGEPSGNGQKDQKQYGQKTKYRQRNVELPVFPARVGDQEYRQRFLALMPLMIHNKNLLLKE